MNEKSLMLMPDWKCEIEEACVQSNAFCAALYSDQGNLIFANPGMQKLFKSGNRDSFINPTLQRLLNMPYDNPLIFEGHITIGDENFANTTLVGKVYRKQGQMLVLGEIDVEQLTCQNEIMLRLNNEISNLQRQLIKEKKTLERTLKQFKELNATKDKFFSIIAHDLKNPFATIIGFADLLKDNVNKYDSIKLEAILNHIYTSSSMAHELLENLLVWAQSQKGAIEFHPESFDFKALIIGNINIAEKQAVKKQVLIETTIKEPIPVFADKNMLHTVVRNLLTNAIKYTHPQGNVKIGARLYPAYVEISVADTGVGMRDEIKNKLFRIDEHITSKGTENEKGTGLGLILCKEFVEKHGGKIWVESEIGAGSVFYFTIPKKNSDAA
jgi:signal transduction histidine kinase